MTEHYVRQAHCFVRFDFDEKNEDASPWNIALFTGEFFWVNATYADEFPEDCKMVGDGRSNGYDVDGCCIVSVPASHAKEFYTPEEVEDLERAKEIDQRLLRYAR